MEKRPAGHRRRYASGSIEADIEPFERASSRSAPKA